MENLLRAKQPDNVCNDKGQLFEALGRFHSSAGVQYFGALGLKGESYTDISIDVDFPPCSKLFIPLSQVFRLFSQALLTVFVCFVSLVCC